MAVDALARAMAAGKFPVDAYELAVAGGYTGTRQQFEADMGESGTNASIAASAAAAALASAETASNAASDFAPVYSSSDTYSAGDYVLYEDALYKCISDITTGESWDASHWVSVKFGTELTGLSDSLTLTNTFVMNRVPVTLPEVVRGQIEITGLAAGKSVISGTHNASELLHIKDGTYTYPGVTVTVSGNVVTVSGTPTSAVNHSFVDGTSKTGTELAAMSLGIPVHVYALSMYVTTEDTTAYPNICVRSKSSGNVVQAQSNVAEFTMDPSTCGGFYMALTANRAYNLTFVIGLFPFTTGITAVYKQEASDVTIYSADGTYDLDGYTWSDDTPTVVWLKSKLPKRPMCVYSTRTVAYTGLTQTLDIYLPTKVGYANWIFGHTINSNQNGDVWRLVQINAVNDGLLYDYHITQLGETEMAIHLVGEGENDFIGGFTHGDEMMDPDSFLVLLDGKPTDVTTITSLTEFTKLQIFLVSNMYDPADHVTLVGVHGREWSFDETGLMLSQTVEFKADRTLTNSYMPMFCALRGNDTASTKQITDTYVDDGNFMPYDVGTGGFTTYPSKLKKDVRKIYLSGKTSGVEASVEIIEQPEGLKGEGSYLYNVVNTYNKIYCCLCGYGNASANYQAVTSGDKWKIKSKIEVRIG